MISRFTETLREMTLVQILENSTLFIILILGLIMFFKSSSPFNKYFIPIVCIAATVLRLVHWAQYGNQPNFMTPVVEIVSSWLS